MHVLKGMSRRSLKLNLRKQNSFFWFDVSWGGGFPENGPRMVKWPDMADMQENHKLLAVRPFARPFSAMLETPRELPPAICRPFLVLGRSSRNPVRQIYAKLLVFRFVHHTKGAQQVLQSVIRSKVNFGQFYANPMPPSRNF